MNNRTVFYIALIIVVLFLGILLINSPNIKHAPHLDDLDSGGFLDAIYGLALASLILFLAAGLGRIIIKPFKLAEWTFIERTVISLPLGLAAIGYSEFFIGLLGWLRPVHHIVLLAFFTLISFKNSVDFLTEGISSSKQFPIIWREFSIIKKFFFSVGALALLLAFVQTLTPPYDYDGLMYHLQGPRLFLDAGRIIPIPENWFTFYPATWEMVYMLGMGLGSDIFARLIHFSTLLLLLLGTYAFGKRFVPSSDGWLPAAILVGIPILLVWGTFAYTDLAWAFFQFIAIVFLLIWSQKRETQYIVLSGITQGLALGTKYLAITGTVILILGIIWVIAKDKQEKNPWKSAIRNILIFGFTAALVASPWYVKNLIWTGNPVFPLYLPQNMIDPVEIGLWMDYINSFGTGHNWHDYLILPVNLYLQFPKYGTFVGNMDLSTPLFLLIFAYPWTRRRILVENRTLLDLLAILTMIMFIAWALGSQQNRFLTPLYPGLAIIASSVICALARKVTKIRWDKIVTAGGIGGTIIASLIIMVNLVSIIQPLKVITGVVSKSNFLASIIEDFSGVMYVNQKLPEDSRVLMPWDGRGYYCFPGKCRPDVDQNAWTALVQRSRDNSEVIDWLEANGITHILISNADVAYFVYGHDQQNYHTEAVNLLKSLFSIQDGGLIFNDEYVSLIKIINSGN